MRILYVEPDASVGRAMERLLHAAGWTVDRVCTAGEAEDRVIDGPRPDAVVTVAGRITPTGRLVAQLCADFDLPVCVFSGRGHDASEADLSHLWILKTDHHALLAWLRAIALEVAA